MYRGKRTRVGNLCRRFKCWTRGYHKKMDLRETRGCVRRSSGSQRSNATFACGRFEMHAADRRGFHSELAQVCVPAVCRFEMHAADRRGFHSEPQVCVVQQCASSRVRSALRARSWHVPPAAFGLGQSGEVAEDVSSFSVIDARVRPNVAERRPGTHVDGWCR